MKWVRKPRGEPLTSPDGRFVITGGSPSYRVRDKEGRSYRCANLAEVRRVIRELAGDIYDHDTLEQTAWYGRHPADVAHNRHDEVGLARGHNSRGGAVHYLDSASRPACSAWRMRNVKETPDLRVTCGNCMRVAMGPNRDRIARRETGPTEAGPVTTS